MAILFQISLAFSHLLTGVLLVNILSLTSTLSDQKNAHFMPNSIVGSHDKYVEKCTVFVGICWEIVVNNLLSEVFMIVEQRLWPKLY